MTSSLDALRQEWDTQHNLQGFSVASFVERLLAEAERLAAELEKLAKWKFANEKVHVEDALVEANAQLKAENARLTAALEQKRVCTVCWTASQAPVESEDECDWQHPHEGGHSRCDLCWLHERFVEQKGTVERLEAQVAALSERTAIAEDNANYFYSQWGKMIKRAPWWKRVLRSKVWRKVHAAYKAFKETGGVLHPTEPKE